MSAGTSPESDAHDQQAATADAPRDTALSHLAAQRVEYLAADLSEVAADPGSQFAAWYEEAAAQVAEPNAMVVATADASGPSARVVLLKEFGPEGFVFFTNYDSLKGRQLAADPRIALTFPWQDMQRQVRVRGVAEPTSAAVSDEYFASRARGAQLSAVASAQSQPVRSRADLEAAYAQAQERFGSGPVERPAHWGGYLVRPSEVEFWQGRGNRFHDRYAFTSADGRPARLDDPSAWTIVRLNP
ncbi:pyridoxamine 5'-phosphate oxidase [Brevibacterium sp. 5221]|uniref:Pyridoxine/pyridoxamine 5'-phosphate oxidase n=1 Tax=Brevibacterium rongguiense TaxID=2695267 RepID=A0A6N9H906_9MICO|nr:pyridoxamine 5'-phosphate oxidase [Brevibacterium rongguiense]MYM19982.1 pyridoxamine 5'-phosphate oxidase [Brevibacterium rongguiense]